jgi:octopine/nopaline transport system substrate-binding protein
MKKLLILTAVAVALVSGQAVAGKYDSITIATEGAYKPWNFKDAAGNLVGFEIDFANDLCKRMGTKCKIVEQAWDGIIPSLQAGKYDAIIAGMSITDKRKKVITFSRDYLSGGGGLVVVKSSPLAGFDTGMAKVNLAEIDAGEQASLDMITASFGGKTIGVQTATTHENFLKEYLGDKATIRSYDTQENLDLDLEAGRVDAALASMDYWVPLLKSDKGQNFKQVGPAISGGPFGNGTGVGIRKEDAALADMFSKAIGEAIADGTCEKMAMKWFGFNNCSLP